ncbi:hypothetical protein [Leucobacter sp. wl10]|uniref:hypothetical protein n=1 Tax=Leucobacter sp. wl10 TaxID=2304677 RepID=UPI000E5BFF35|nr:hypothetical protein [Leucobacter sp. wl10]RGE19070.1 hypothetical protein D1J51_13185 [Leucobacter sp. wl10]
MIQIPFTAAELFTDDPEVRERAAHIGNYFRQALGPGILFSLGARELRAVPGTDQMGGLMFIASILPMTQRGRGQAARRMAVMISLTALDLIDVEVRVLRTGSVHAKIDEITIDRLGHAVLALDYDGDTVLNPRYWN